MTRKRPRNTRVRREPIDLEQLAAEFADLPDPEPAPTAETRVDEQEILVALEAEVERVQAARAAEEPDPEPVSRVGLPLDQVRAWMEQVQEDLRRIQTRLQYLEAEQTRLQEQHHIVAELLTSSTPV